MKNQQIKSLLVLVFTCVVLAACTDSSITEVKKSSMPQSDFTYGEVLDDAKGCKSTEWNRRDDENGRPVVEYNCTAEISSNLIEKARTDNIEIVKSLTKALQGDWQRELETLERGKDTVEAIAVAVRKKIETDLNNFNAQLQKAQENLRFALASTPENYIGHGPSGYTPSLLEVGKDRMQLAIMTAKRELDVVQREIEATKQLQNDPAVVGRQFGSDQYLSASEYQGRIDDMNSWKDRYYAAANELDVRELKNAEEFLSAAKDRKLQMKITFLVKKKSPVEIQSATWVYDDNKHGAVNIVALSALLLNPKIMQQILNSELMPYLKFKADYGKYVESFPIECNKNIPKGCKLKNSSVAPNKMLGDEIDQNPNAKPNGSAEEEKRQNKKAWQDNNGYMHYPDGSVSSRPID